MKKISSVLMCTLVLTVFSACGGGGDSGFTVQQPTTAVITLATAATSTIPATTTINSYNVTITLPAGVTVKSTNPPETDAGVVTASGKASGASITGVYTVATGTFPAMVKLYVVEVDPITGAGFDPGEFCIVKGDIAAGHYPTASSFAQPTLDDASGIDISTSTVTLTGQLSLSATAVVQ